MTLKIEVEVPFDIIKNDRADEYLRRALSAIGYERSETAAPPVALQGQSDAPPSTVLQPAISGETGPGETEEAPAPEEQPKRERGKPAPGRSRRTKEEIAEDEAADKAEADEPKANISATPEHRVDPAVAEQDAEDEQAEVEATAAPELTVADVHAALNSYVRAYGMAAVMEDGPKIFSAAFGPNTNKCSDIPETQEAWTKAIAAVNEAIAKNPFGRKADL